MIMADGHMQRWKAECDTPKHLLRVEGETLLERLVRQLRSGLGKDEVIITSHDRRYEVSGAVRHEPENNHLEIDRFTWELIDRNTCFLYGDTCYTDAAIQAIRNSRTDQLHFFGTDDAIVAVIVGDPDVLRFHIWQVYQSYVGLPFGPRIIGPEYTVLTDGTQGFNTPAEYEAFRTGSEIYRHDFH